MSLDYKTITLRKFSGLTDRIVDSSPNMFSEINNFRLDKNGNMVLREGCETYAYGNADLPKLLRRNKAGKLYGITEDSTFYEDASGNIQSGNSFITPNAPKDVLASANDWRGIEYITFGRDKSPDAIASNTTRFNLFSLYMAEVPDDLVPASFVPSISQTGCPHLDTPPEIGQAAGITNTLSDTMYYIAYQQTITANEGTSTPITQASFGQGVYSSLLKLDRERAELPLLDPPAVSISVIKNPYRSDYEDTLPVAMVYRTHPLDLNTFYLVKEVTFVGAADSSFADTMFDDELLTQERLYISEGITEMEQPPKHSCSTIINGTAFYGNIEIYDKTDGVDRTYKEFNYKVVQSMQGNPTMVNRSFFVDFEEEVIGLGGLHNALIVFTKTKIVRVDGFKNNDGSGGYNQRTISDDAGCVSHKSIISDGNSLYFFGNNGVYTTNGYDVVKISSTPNYDITETYEEYVKDFTLSSSRNVDLFRDRATGYYDSRRDVLYWAVCADGAVVQNELLVFDKFNTCFYVLGGNSQNYPAMLIEDDYFLRANDRTSIFKHHDGVLSDIVAVDDSESEWFESYIPYGAKTVGIDFGDPSTKKWVSYIVMTITTISKTGIGLNSYNDISNSSKDMKAITISDVLLWRDRNLRWRDTSMTWRSKNTDTHKRRFPKRALRCRYKQLEFAPTDTELYSSDTFDTVNMTYVTTGIDTKLKFSFDKFEYYHDISIDESDPLNLKYLITRPDRAPLWLSLCYDENGNRCPLFTYSIDETIFNRILNDAEFDAPATLRPRYVFTTADPTHTIQVDWDATVGNENSFNVTIRDSLSAIVYPDFRIESYFTSKQWPDDVLSYQISFEEEEYDISYLIIDSDNNASVPFLLAEGGGDVSLGNGKNFKMFGIRKRQSFRIENLTYKYAPLSDKGVEYLAQGVGSGE